MSDKAFMILIVASEIDPIASAFSEKSQILSNWAATSSTVGGWMLLIRRFTFDEKKQHFYLGINYDFFLETWIAMENAWKLIKEPTPGQMFELRKKHIF